MIRWPLTGAFLCVILVILLLKSPVLDPSLNIETDSYPGKSSEVFFQTSSGYTGINSERATIDPTTRTFTFNLRGNNSNVRWDPLESEGTFGVKSVYISSFYSHLKIPLEDITPINQIEKTESQLATQFVVPKLSNDPQLDIKIPKREVHNAKLLAAIMIAICLTLFLLAVLKWRRKLIAAISNNINPTNKIRKIIDSDSFSGKEFLTFFGLGIAINILPLVNFFISIDDEWGAYRTNPDVWIFDGRWGAYLVERFIFPQPVMPFAPGLFFYACLAAAFMLIIRACNIRPSWKTSVAYCVFIAHPIWWFIGEFYSNIPSTGLGILTLSIALYINTKLDVERCGKVGYCLAIASAGMLLAFSIGAYQSLIMFYIAAGVGTLLLAGKEHFSRQLDGVRPLPPSSFLKWSAVSLALTFIVGLIFYAAINKLAQWLFPSDRNYIGNFLKINELLQNPGDITTLVLSEMLKIYTGAESAYGASFTSLGALIGLAFICLAIQHHLKIVAWTLAAMIALLIAPFLLHFLAGGSLPLRSMLPVALVGWIAVTVVLQQKGILYATGLTLSLLLLVQMVSTNGQYAASTILATSHDRMTAEGIYLRMASLDSSFDREKNVVLDIYGSQSFHGVYPNPQTSTMSASFFDWDSGSITRMVGYMRLIGLTNLSIQSPAIRKNNTPFFENMPVWPAKDSVKLKDGIYYIKLSQKSDPVHSQPIQTNDE
jgi:hypothetical protein